MSTSNISIPKIEDFPEYGDLWQKKRLTPFQLLVHDVRLERWRPDADPRLEVRERITTELVPPSAVLTSPSRMARVSEAARNPIERNNLSRLEDEFGWMSSLRIPEIQQHVDDSESSSKLRWIHISSKFPEYLRGCLWALSDIQDPSETAESIQTLDEHIRTNERYSKHGKYFEPFSTSLAQDGKLSTSGPFFLSTPFLDWSLSETAPQLRFNVDKREGFRSSRSASHLLRSILQHFYRLEDTAEREKGQVFNKHKPWRDDRDLDLRVRRWYGKHPTSLSVDELWILVIDPQHIVTFSSNQSWKSRWPALQLAARIANVSFRSTRDENFATSERQIYTALTHSVVCLSGAVGMLHRSFWADIVLPLSERFANYLGHLQYRVYRAPSQKLVIDLMQVQEELNIIVRITQKQLGLIHGYESLIHANIQTSSIVSADTRPVPIPAPPGMTDSVRRLTNNLQMELNDLQDLLDNTNSLVTRTIQLVDLRQEDHGNAIMVFTIVTIVFLPLNFVCSFFGMNVSDIRNMTSNQSLFWIIASCVTLGVTSASLVLAFNGSMLRERFVLWKERRRHLRRQSILTQSC